jgi:Helicase HerA, central domain
MESSDSAAGNGVVDGAQTTAGTATSISGFVLPLVPVDIASSAAAAEPPMSPFSKEPTIAFAHLQRLGQGEGEILYHPTKVPLAIGDVLYLRERSVPDEAGRVEETGAVVQVIGIGTANYQAAEQKSLFRLMTAVRADELKRSYHEPPETLDEFMEARVHVRAAIEHGAWKKTTGQAVTRNVDIFVIDPSILLREITQNVSNLNLDLGTYKNESVTVFGGGFEKVNLITGMKGAGKSHIAKGIIDQNRSCGVSALVFDVNDNDAYDQLPSARALEPGKNLKFRLDRMHPEAFLLLLMRLAPPGEATQFQAYARLPKILEDRKRAGHCPDIPFLRTQSTNIIPGSTPVDNNMRASLDRSYNSLESLNLFMTEDEARAESPLLSGAPGASEPPVLSLSAALATTIEAGPSVLVIKLAGLISEQQKAVVRMIIEHIKILCKKQSDRYDQDPSHVPIYPSIFFEEAHMYMEEADIDALIPIVRHIGPNLFFITNTPDALPDSVIRLVDNLVLTRLINSKDVARVKACGLTDGETLAGFAGDLPVHHALLLSGLDGCTQGFPLVFRVRDFGLPASGRTRSVWSEPS